MSFSLSCVFVASGKAVSTSPMLYSDWLEPDQPDRHGENCLSVGCELRGRCGWSDESCSKYLPYICEHCTSAGSFMIAIMTVGHING